MEHLTFDIVVCGSGVSGLSAAITASRLGMKTVLLEKSDEIGGTIAHLSQSFLCGLYDMTVSDVPLLLNTGLVSEIVDELYRDFPNLSPVRMGKVVVLPTIAASLFTILRDRVEHETTLTILKSVSLESVHVVDSLIRSICVATSESKLSIAAKAVIDCSEDGDCVRLSGASYVETPMRKRQLAGFTAVVDGVEGEADMLEFRVPYCLRAAIDVGTLPHFAKFTQFSLSSKRGEGVFKFNVPPDIVSSGDTSITDIVKMIFSIVKHNVSAFSRSSIREVSKSLSMRDGCALSGLYTLTEDDVLQGKHFDDGVVRGAWPIEFWDQTIGPKYKYLKPGTYYEIPLRCLLSQDIENLFVAGKNISATSQALASTRVAGTCISLAEESVVAAVASIKKRANE